MTSGLKAATLLVSLNTDSPIFQYRLSSFDDAKAAYKKALELDPANTMTQNGLSAVKSAEASRNAAPDIGLGKIFSDPNLITELRNNPKTAELMNDPELLSKVLHLQSSPQAGTTVYSGSVKTRVA